MRKSMIVRKGIIELLSDRKMHCIQDVSLYVKNLCKVENIEISDTLINYNIQTLYKNGVIDKYGKFVKIKTFI